ncbi:MAG: membrane dipeptidase [Cyclobacteriaceae bacterium]
MAKTNFIIDAHLDLATNAMVLNRDLTRPVHDIRQSEKALKLNDFQDRGNGTVALPELRKGQIGLVFATMISRVSEEGSVLETMSLPGWRSPQQAFANAMCQLNWYREMEEMGEMIQIKTKDQLTSHLKLWANAEGNQKKPIGYILALEGADSIVNLDYLERYYDLGLRSIGISHFGPGRYAAGTHSNNKGLTTQGVGLLEKMNQMNMLLDLTHLTDKGFYEAIDIYRGKVIASHQNCRSIVEGERQFSDDQINVIIERGGVIGGALDTWMLHPDFKMGKDDPKSLGINLEKLVDHFDHICQMAGNTKHVGIGSDLDGLFGLEQSPMDLDTIADLQKFRSILSARGYADEDIENIMYKNWVNLLMEVLP